MQSNRYRLCLLAPLAALLLAPSVPASGASIHVDFNDHVQVRDQDVVITRDEGGEARISPLGDLTIDGRTLVVRPRERRELRRYNASVHAVEAHAKEIGLRAAGVAITALGEGLASVVTGDDSGAESRVEARAKPLKVEARELCKEVRRLSRLQSSLVESIPEFAPYAVIDPGDCHVDD